jgi:S-(hydroxymethyl)glutathione dehydrogenase/alcohol dehydrogenase
VRAALFEKVGAPLTMTELELDTVGPTEVRVRVAASGVCHTDRTVQLSGRPAAPPLVLGHEVSGIVEEVGCAVAVLAPGDKVVATAGGFCGRCRWCQVGQHQHCSNHLLLKHRPPGSASRISRNGIHVQPLFGIGGFATEILVDQALLAQIPDDMPLDRAALLGCAVHTGIGAVRHTAGIGVGDTVAVIGCGGVGLNAVQGARLAGASRIIAVDIQESKLERARRFGATDVVDAAATDPVTRVRELTGGGVDHAIEVVGSTTTIEQAFAMTGIRGTATVVGLAREDVMVSVPAVELMSEKRMQGSKLGKDFFLDIEWYCSQYLAGTLLLDELISERIELTDVNRGLENLDNPVGARSVIVFE